MANKTITELNFHTPIENDELIIWDKVNALTKKAKVSDVLGVTSSDYVKKGYDHYPYIIDWEDPAPTDDLSITFNSMTLIWDYQQVLVSSWTYTFIASKITNVWVDSGGAITYESVDPANYTSLHRYTDKFMLAEITTGATKVVAVYFRGDSRMIIPAVSKRPINLHEFFINYYIKPHTDDWGAIAVSYGDVVSTTAGYLYYVVKGGTLDSLEPSAPSYEYEAIAGFHEQESGTAVIVYIGRDTYEGAWKPAYTNGIRWYFANLGIGWLAKSGSSFAESLSTEMLNHIRIVIDRAICPHQLEHSYYYGMLVTDSAGYIWQCRNDGTSHTSVSFPASPTAKVTEYEDNDITWLCFGRTSVNSPIITWQLGDTTVTMDEFRLPDSHDSYAATLMWALEQLRLAGFVPDGFFTENSKHGITYVAALKEILYYNVLIQTENNLSRTFQYNIVPDGSDSEYNIQFFMDNCEVWAGLQAAYDFYSDSRYTIAPEYPAYVAGFRDTILVGLQSLWDETTERFTYYLGYDPSNDPENPLFYPWIMSQTWASLWDVPLDYYQIRAAMNYIEEAYPDWWQTNRIDDLAALGSHVGLYKFNSTVEIRKQILDRVEAEKMLVSTSELYLHDLGYYLFLKEK